jgi:hypothetical protein
LQNIILKSKGLENRVLTNGRGTTTTQFSENKLYLQVFSDLEHVLNCFFLKTNILGARCGFVQANYRANPACSY